MNSTKSLPIIQEELFASDKKDDIQALVDDLSGSACECGVTVIRNEESYTSKASFLDNDDIPVYVEGDETKHHFSGRRVQRGLYRSSDGTVLNADINGAANILRKAGYDTSAVKLTNLLNPEVFTFADLSR